MSGWHNVELFAVPILVRTEYYGKISSNKEEEVECAYVLTVRSPPVFAYYLEAALADESNAPAIWHVAIIGYFVIKVLRLLAAVYDGAVGVACRNSRMGRIGCGVLVHLPSGVHREVNDIHFLEITCCCRFEPVSSSVATAGRSKLIALG